MIWGGEQYSRIRLVVGIQQLYYRVDTWISDDKDGILDLFPSMQIAHYVDLIYCIDTDDFIKFRWEHKEIEYYREFFKNSLMQKLTIEELKSTIEDVYDVKLHIWSKDKWEKFATLE